MKIKKVKKFIKNNIKVVIAFILGISIAGSIGVYAATVINASSVAFSGSTSGLTSTNMQAALNEAYNNCKTKCPDGYNCINKPKSFSADSWDTIAKNVKIGNISAYNVGDMKTIDMGSLGTHTVRVANTSACTNGETSQTACGFVVEFADIITKKAMNSTDTNVGGWPASAMRTYVNSTIYNALPSDLQGIIADTTVVSGHGSTSGAENFTSTDKLYLLSTKEVWGKDGTSNKINNDTAEAETRQLDYYKNLGVTTANYSGAIKQYNGSNYYWWLRSALSDTTNRFFGVIYGGDWAHFIATNASGVSPAFRIA